MWFLYKKVVLTKDKLIKRRCVGVQEVCRGVGRAPFFIRCKFAKLVWQVVHFIFNMPPPTNIKNLFGNWLNNIDRKTKSRIRVGVCAILWTIWCSTNDVIFSNAMTSQFLQVMHRVVHWINIWPFLQA
jgi:hypothetical protein